MKISENLGVGGGGGGGGCVVFILSIATKITVSEWKVGCLYTTVNFQWKTFRRYITAQPKDDIKEQLNELFISSMLETMCPNLNILTKFA